MASFLGRSMQFIAYGKRKKLAIWSTLCRWIGRLALASLTHCHGEKKFQRSKFYSCSIQRSFEQPPVSFSNFSSFHRRFFGVARTMHWCPWKHAGFAPHHHGAAENHARGSSRLGAFAATSNLTSFFDQGCIWLWPHQTKASCSVPPTQTTETIRLSRRLLSWRKNTSCTSLTLAYIVLTLGPKAKTGSLAISCC